MYNDAPEAGLASLLASRGRNGDSVLVHMAPEEVQGLQALAMAHGGELTINPDTGLYEANILKKFLPMIAGAVLNTVAPGVGGAIGKFFGLSGTAASTLGTGLLVGGVTGLIEGDLKKGLMAGIGAYSGANLAQSLQGASVGAGMEPERLSAEELTKTNQAVEAAKQTIGARPVYNPTGTETDGLDYFKSANVFKGTPTVGDLDIGRQAIATGATTPDQILDFTKSANVFKGTPTPMDLSTGRAANIAGTGMRGVGEGIMSLVQSPQSRGAFIDRLGGGFQSNLGQSAAKYATLMGVSDALTPEYEMPSGYSGDDTVYIPGGFNPMYGYGREHGYFLPGKYYKKTKQGLVPYNPYAMAPGYATGGPVQAPDQNMNQQRSIPHQNATFPYPNQNYPLSTVTGTPYPAMQAGSAPQPQEIIGNYEPNVNPYTGEQQFADGGPVEDEEDRPPVGVAPPPPNPFAQPTEPVANRPPPPSPFAQPAVPVTNPPPPPEPSPPSPLTLPQDGPPNPFAAQRQRYVDMLNAPPPAPVDTKPTMDYLDQLSRRARQPEFMVFPPGGITGGTGGGTGGTGGTGGDKGDKGDKNEPGGGRGGRETGGGTGTGSGSGGGTGVIGGGTGTGTGGTGTGTGGTGPKTGGGPPGTGKDEGDADENQDDVEDAEKEDDDSLLDKAKGKFMEWFDKRFRDPYGLVGTAIGLTGAGMLGTWAWDKLTPNIKKFFATPEGLTEAQQLEIEEAVRAQLEEEKAKQEQAAKDKEKQDKENEGRTSRRENRGGEGRGGAGVGGGAGGGGGFGSGSRRGVITIEEDVLPARKGGRIRAMQAGGLPTPPNPYGAAVGEDYNFGFAQGGMPEYKAGGKLLDGPGDGMSDSIPAVIRGKGVQRAALADGEFVIPADVVSHLGNGSTKAGAKKLYAMMDRIRQARTGKTRQAPEVKADKYMPA
jgi:hypothetical protein